LRRTHGVLNVPFVAARGAADEIHFKADAVREAHRVERVFLGAAFAKPCNDVCDAEALHDWRPSTI
jgi:hypothetical protein